MRRRCLIAIIAALIFVCAPAQAQVIVYEVFGAYLDSLRGQAGIPGLAAAIVLRCAEERRLSLDDTVGSFKVPTVEPDATVRQLLTHTSGAPDGLTFFLRPERLTPLRPIVRACARDSYRENMANLLHRLGMFDSVPGPDIVKIARPEEGVPHPSDVERY